MRVESRLRLRLRQRRKRRRRKSHLLALLVLLILISSVAGALIGYQQLNASYHRYVALAQAGVQQLKDGQAQLQSLPQHPFEVTIVQDADHDFSKALDSFHQLEVGLQSVPSMSTAIPMYGDRLSAAQHLIPVAINISQAGIAGCHILTILMQRLQDPLKANASGFTLDDMQLITQNFELIKQTTNVVIDQIQMIQPADVTFDPQISRLLTTFSKYLPALKQGLETAESLITVAPILLGIGTSANYLIEILDSTELRPAGGFIGNIGIATLSGGRMNKISVTDVDLLDKPYLYSGKKIEYPAIYNWFDLAPASWSLRDSNLDADFPTVAQYGEQNYKIEGGNVPVIGVVAITPALIQDVLTITGPINVPEYHETITAQNLIDRIHYYQLQGGSKGVDYIPSSDGLSSQRKHFMSLLSQYLLDQVRHFSASSLTKLVRLFGNAVYSKDIQIFFNIPAAENILHQYKLDSAIQSPEGDSLFVVDANISANKANPYFKNTLTDLVTIDATGTVTHHTTLSYAWILPGASLGNTLYRDYVRVYVPLDSTLISQNGWEWHGSSTAFGRQVWAGFFTLNWGYTNIVNLVWSEPHALKKTGNSWHYQYLTQRQPGNLWIQNLTITLPTCAVISNTTGLTVNSDKHSLGRAQPLTGDTTVSLDYTCSSNFG